jgi:hypothetical protein
MGAPVVNMTVRSTDAGAIDGTYRMLPGTTFGIYVRTAYCGWSNLQVRGPLRRRLCSPTELLACRLSLPGAASAAAGEGRTVPAQRPPLAAC